METSSRYDICANENSVPFIMAAEAGLKNGAPASPLTAVKASPMADALAPTPRSINSKELSPTSACDAPHKPITIRGTMNFGNFMPSETNIQRK